MGHICVFFAPLFPVFSENVGGGKVVRFFYPALLIVGNEQFVLRGVEKRERIVFLREIFKVEFPVVEGRYRRRRGDSDYPVRPEQIPVRVYQPPFAVDFLRAEVAGCLVLSAAGPTSETVAICGAGLFSEFFLLFFCGFFQFGVGVYFAGPFPEFKLPVFVHEREKFLLAHIKP